MMAALCWASLATGCGINRRYANNVIHQLPHSSVHIEYAWTTSPDSAMQASLPAVGTGTHTLSVVYPHPNENFGRKYAQVTLRTEPSVKEASANRAIAQLITNPFREHEAAALREEPKEPHTLRIAVTREDMEFLLRDLVADSFFDREERDGGVDLTATLDSRSVQKKWDRVTAFDQLAARVVNENQKILKQRLKTSKPTILLVELLQPILDDDEEPVQEIINAEQLSREPIGF